MNTIKEFYTPQLNDLEKLVRPYQEAFAGDPWYEVSKCVDDQIAKRCPGALSKLAVGQTCTICDRTLADPAYESNKLIARFIQLQQTMPTAWYRETTDSGDIAVASVAWRADSKRIATDKYSDMPPMTTWLEKQLGTNDIAWLDEVFADKTVQTAGNLNNFGTMITGIMGKLGCRTLAYRTLNEAMIRAAERDFGDSACVFKAAKKTVPDRRDFVIITVGASA